MKLNYITEKCFFEKYGSWPEYGDGVMLVYVEPPKTDQTSQYRCEYVLFKPYHGFKHIIINEDLLNQYNKEG